MLLDFLRLLEDIFKVLAAPSAAVIVECSAGFVFAGEEAAFEHRSSDDADAIGLCFLEHVGVFLTKDAVDDLQCIHPCGADVLAAKINGVLCDIGAFD